MDHPGALPPLAESASETAAEEPTAPVASDSTSAPAPSLPPPTSNQPSETLGLGESAKLLTPQSLLDSVHDQLLGGKTQEQLQREQQAAAQAQQAASLNRQAFESQQAQSKAQEQQRVQETVQLKNQAKQMGSYEESSAVLSQTTGGDLSEQTVIHSAMQAAKERHAREQRARQLMAQQKAVRKGPQAEGAEGQGASMTDKMQGVAETTSQAEDQDALQRQAEQAMGE